ncbi:hypothetical protein SAMN03159382_05242 [Pseudomonas sp. NFACC23-1]|nr:MULTISPECIES: DUF6124 family protein [unclassified Pseudomonas]SDB63120.1 hypothetical protein SAMN03159386_05212 [Pseudomonas sp. NFACC17-2]SEJ91178.1 hypothetical protein SAMN03159382_05242 [Pseudomonas sp. NFACC23-1]SFW87185.1 hypothetical protein SAMN05660640_04630 [Pseudomonas sp. NFACC16-2]
MVKPSPNLPQSGHKSRVQAQEEKKLEDAATRALDYYLNPKPASPPEPDKNQLFIVSPHIDTETLLANASEDLLSISTIAADLADDVDDSRRCVLIVPTLLRGNAARDAPRSASECDAERHGMHSHPERGNDQNRGSEPARDSGVSVNINTTDDQAMTGAQCQSNSAAATGRPNQ